jgi:hypothetical protein
MTEECRRPEGWRYHEPQRGRCQREYVCDEQRCSIDGNGRRGLLALILDQPHAIERVERPLLAALLAADLRLLRHARFRAPDDLFARVLAEEPRTRHRRSGDDGEQSKKRGGTPRHGPRITDPLRHCQYSAAGRIRSFASAARATGRVALARPAEALLDTQQRHGSRLPAPSR